MKIGQKCSFYCVKDMFFRSYGFPVLIMVTSVSSTIAFKLNVILDSARIFRSEFILCLYPWLFLLKLR